MAEEYNAPKIHECDASVVREEVVEVVEAKDRGIFDFMKKDGEEEKDEHDHDHDHHPHHEEEVKEEVIVAEFEEKANICQGEKLKEEEKKKHKLGGWDGSSSSSSSDEEDEEKKKLKKERKEKKKKGEETSVPVEKCSEEVIPPPLPPITADEKKGFLEKIKEKIPVVGAKKSEEVSPPTPPPSDFESSTMDAPPPCEGGEAAGKEKKGILEKIKEKIPGYHHKSHEEEKEKEIDASG